MKAYSLNCIIVCSCCLLTYPVYACIQRKQYVLCMWMVSPIRGYVFVMAIRTAHPTGLHQGEDFNYFLKQMIGVQDAEPHR